MMDSSSQAEEENKKITEVKIFPIPFSLGEIKENITINTKTPSKLSQQQQVINQAITFHSQGNIPEATKYYKQIINQGCNDHRVFSNYGIILKNLGNLKEAELSYRKAIEINPDYVNAHYNLGGILQDLGNLKEAELSYRKAIKIKHNEEVAHSNLGIVLKDLGQLKEAELSLRKAIEINPNFAEAHSNLGGILKDLGKLKEAELFTRKAIEINPNFAEAHSNLAGILNDLGKLEELLLLSESILELKTINQGYKLLASLEITIANLIRGNFSETLLSINKNNELINKGAIYNLKSKKNRKYVSTFSRFITSLYSLLEKENNNHDAEIIPHFGESHCLSFAHQTLSISLQLKKIQPVLITGGKAWHFANKKNNKWKDSLTQQITNHTYSNRVFISFGEIDCRKDEGILTYSIKKDKDILEVCKKTITGYLDYMEEILSPNHSKRYYFGVPAPTRPKELLDELDIKRIKMIQLYNSLLQKEVLSRGSYFLDVYNLTSNENGENNNIHMCDTTHLSPKCLSILFENYLYKS